MTREGIRAMIMASNAQAVGPVFVLLSLALGLTVGARPVAEGSPVGGRIGDGSEEERPRCKQVPVGTGYMS